MQYQHHFPSLRSTLHILFAYPQATTLPQLVLSATVAEAAQAVGCMAGEIAKTISFIANGKAILIVAAGDSKIDLQFF